LFHLYVNALSLDFKFEQIAEPPPPAVDDEVRRKEEEELQRVLEMSLHDKGGRNMSAWGNSAANNGAGGSKQPAAINLPGPSSSSSYAPAEPPKSAYPAADIQQRGEESVSRREASPPPVLEAARASIASLPEVSSVVKTSGAGTAPKVETSSGLTVTRVRALHTFEPSVPGELAFEKGDIIKVTDRAYDNWWRGQLKGRTGIFPVNYVVRILLFIR
jgi:signal transducing adaptor molecule